MLPHSSMREDFMPHGLMPDGQRQRMDNHMSPVRLRHRWHTSALQVITPWGDGYGQKRLRDAATGAGSSVSFEGVSRWIDPALQL
jgi:hypothetical protein